MQSQHRHITDAQWNELAAEPEFKGLVRARRLFVVPAMAFVTIFYMLLPVLTGFEPALMTRPVLGPLTLAYCFALLQFPVGWALLALYLWRARSFDLTAARCRKHEIEEVRA